ncbi:aldehyde dehydrogenase [Flavobacterium gilvum]|uniref:Aldehyde dehydrogenase n=1 Tax=Flavobacterium gilvum TaxID=1492737 RepID=A0AAC9I7Y0_9FLAO|nr:aldehyde dehydrogenase [Flavobacterium gilvum]AOW10523.1 aldehyde dehydrogenase [Flavobacterium gilvum]KFC57833.1 aldehyde dehydrogenase [Flavobacterium gilvum]
MNYKLNINERKEALVKLLDVIIKHEDEIIEALQYDFKKPPFETIATEISYVVSELKYTIKNINKWAKIRQVFPSLLNFPSTDYVVKEPYGKVLIISPWNYPFQLAVCPMISAVAAGNQIVLKPSELAPKTSAIVLKIVEKTFHHQHVRVIEGDAGIAQKLLKHRWDYIFFTGSVAVGKIVAKAAAEHLTPVTLELGGKNPCIIDETANLKLAARRIVWGKFLNAGQTCIAPDYILIQERMKSHFVDYLKKEITKAYGKNPKESPDFARIINEKHCYRLMSLIEPRKVIFGGEADMDNCYIAPTLIEEDSLDSSLMSEEIFGPILPIITYKDEKEIAQTLSKYEKPLALYVFTDDRKFARKTVTTFSFGGGCVNDTVIHFANKRLPFGGVGHSGMGAYHGQLSFDTFSHKKGIVKKGNWLDLHFRYAPYAKKIETLKHILKWF